MSPRGGDRREDVNLSRQEGAGPSNVGAAKAEVTAAAMRHANPTVTLIIIPALARDGRTSANRQQLILGWRHAS